MLASLFDGRTENWVVQRAIDDAPFIDRDPEAFRDILNCLRQAPDLSCVRTWTVERQERLRNEADYLGLANLLAALSQELDDIAVQIDASKWVRVCGSGDPCNGRQWGWDGRAGNADLYPSRGQPGEGKLTEGGLYLLLINHLGRPTPRLPSQQPCGDPAGTDQIRPGNPFLRANIGSLDGIPPLADGQSDGFNSTAAINMWIYDCGKTERTQYSRCLSTFSACEVVPLRASDDIGFGWNWHGETNRCTCEESVRPAACTCSPRLAAFMAHEWATQPGATPVRVRLCRTCDRAVAHDCYPHSNNHTGSPSNLLYSFTLLQLGAATAVACFDRIVGARERTARWRPRPLGLSGPPPPTVVRVEEEGSVLTVPSAGAYLIFTRVAVGVAEADFDNEAGSRGQPNETVALLSRAPNAGSAGWVELCCFGRSAVLQRPYAGAGEDRTARVSEMVAISDVRQLEANTSLRIEARNRAVFDDTISGATPRSQSLSLLRIDNAYARFAYTPRGLVPTCSAVWCGVREDRPAPPPDEDGFQDGDEDPLGPRPPMQVRVRHAGTYLVLVTVTKYPHDALGGGWLATRDTVAEICVDGVPVAQTHPQSAPSMLMEPFHLEAVITLDEDEHGTGLCAADEGVVDLRVGEKHPADCCLGHFHGGAEGWMVLVRFNNDDGADDDDDDDAEEDADGEG
jgi:hypothetical protein